MGYQDRCDLLTNFSYKIYGYFFFFRNTNISEANLWDLSSMLFLSSSGPGPGPRSGPGQVPGQVQKVQGLRTQDLDLG